MGKVFTSAYQVPFYAVDVKGDIKISQLINQCLLVSGLHTASLGRDDQFILDHYGLIWVVTDYEVTINRLPRFQEKVTIATQALSYNKLFCYREFVLTDDKGQELLRILASFVLIDVNSRKAVPVPEEVVAPFESEKVKKAVRGPKYPNRSELVGQEQTIGLMDLDMNGHVTNSRYLDWLFDGLDLADFKEKKLTGLNIKYSKEIKDRSNVTIQRHVEGNETFISISSDQGIHAQARLGWEDKE